MIDARTTTWAAAMVLLALSSFARAAEGNPLAGFHDLWSRDAGAGSADLDDRSGPPDEPKAPSIRVRHTGQKDWSLTSRRRLAVTAGDVLELGAYLF